MMSEDEIIQQLTDAADDLGVLIMAENEQAKQASDALWAAVEEIEILRSLIATARVEERIDTEWLCPQDLRWMDCPGSDDCVHDQTRTVVRHTLVWKCETRQQSEVLRKIAWGRTKNQLLEMRAGVDDG